MITGVVLTFIWSVLLLSLIVVYAVYDNELVLTTMLTETFLGGGALLWYLWPMQYWTLTGMVAVTMLVVLISIVALLCLDSDA